MKWLKKLLQWIDDRSGLVKLIIEQAVHPVPPGAKWKYVFGSAVLTAFIVQVVTGIGLLTIYVSSTGGAYQSLQQIDKSPLSNFLRGMHWWGASAMVVMITIHIARVFLTGSFKYPREMNWYTGVILWGLTVGMAATGQVMRWDQNGMWTLVVAAEMAGRVPFIGTWLAHFLLGGDVVGSHTLSRVFAAHVVFVPALLASIVGLHLYLVLHNGISEPPVPGRRIDPATYRKEYEDMLRKEGVPFWPEAIWRDLVFALAMVAGILILAWVFGPEKLVKAPDPSMIHAEPRPDWFLSWFYAMLALLPHAIENYVLIATPIVIGLFLILIPLVGNLGERHPARRPLGVLMVAFLAVSLSALSLAGHYANWSPHFRAAPLTAQIIGNSSGSVYEGAMVFNEKGCLFCHTIDGHGGKRGPDLTYIADRLTRHQILLRIMNGAYNMPVMAHILNTNETENVLDFLSTRKKPGFAVGKQQPAEPAGPSVQAVSPENEGLAIIKSKGCLSCHTTNGKPLVGPSWRGIYGNEVTVIVNGKPVVKTVDEKYLKFMITNPDVWVVKGYQPIMPRFLLTKKEVDKIIAYIKTLKS